MDQAIKDIAAKVGVPEQTVLATAEGCASRLIEWYGSEEAAAEALAEDLQSNMEISLADYNRTMRQMATKALTHPEQFAGTIYQTLQAQSA